MNEFLNHLRFLEMIFDNIEITKKATASYFEVKTRVIKSEK